MTARSPDAFYRPDGDGYLATAWTRGPWDVGAQHGGPPSALLGRAVEELLGGEVGDWIPARASVSLLRPVPIGRLTVRAEIDKRGRTALRASAALCHEGVEVIRMASLLLRRSPDAVAPEAHGTAPTAPPWPPPESCRELEFPFFLDDVGYHKAMEIRLADGWPSPSARAWSRMRCPLVVGEAPSGWQRALCFADAAHGVAPSCDPADVSLVNPDLELSLHRFPQGAWIGLDVHTHFTSDGVGTTRSIVFDAEGRLGGSSATLVVRQR